MNKELVHKFDFVNGTMDIEDIEIISVCSRKNARVDLCIKANLNIPFARIILYDKNSFLNAIDCLDSAESLGKEIERRWRLQGEQDRKEGEL